MCVVFFGSHRIQHPTQLHIYSVPSTKFTILPVILLSDDLGVDDLSESENEALQDGRACFVSLPTCST